MTKVCHLSSVHPATDIRILIKECSSLTKKFNVTLIAIHNKSEIINNVRIIPFNKINNRFFRILFSPYKMFYMAQKHKSEIYHAHDPELLITLLLLKVFTRSKIIYDIHEDVVASLQSKPYINKYFKYIIIFLLSIIENFISKRTDYNITATPFIRDKFLKLNPNTININNYPILSELNANRNPQDNLICYIGAITKIRGLSNLVTSLSLCKIQLYLAGNYAPVSYRDELSSIDGWQNVIELGRIDRSKVREILSYSNAGVVVFKPEPNHINSQPNKLFEYMSASLPIICSDFPLWKEIVEGNKCGVVIDPLKPEKIAQAISYILKNTSEAKQMGENGRKAVEEEYNWKNEEKKLLKLYQELL